MTSLISRQEEPRYKAIEELLSFGHIFEDVRLTFAPQIKESNAKINLLSVYLTALWCQK